MGNEDAASKIPERTQSTLDSWHENGYGRSPTGLGETALNTLMLGNTEQALSTLEIAAAAGWRKYFFVLNDQRWHEAMELPEFKSLMSWVKADIDRQRERVEAIDLKEDFRACIASEEASAQM